MEILATTLPKSRARWTSHAAMYAQTPWRRYSCSTRMERPGPGGVIGWRRVRIGICVFSSALMTNSSPESARPFHCR